ncbi:hypothetical protein SEA_ANNADREAMY_233 [Streptomyces phage Annadreamy]|uniref:Uncharacterized protein n=2 Tax=Annadreamyvirus annadreamy TaxID=2846392 RepID=A0A345GTP4_9CAUD|nr:hypothetical protein HWB75_gp045 [Streptomyces phage Annadreamy]AXG66316.1 hypothetical protein SEA_ANNADREAMY_233 [Streptomyces phage Annadreamy]QGH79541.1 hypothetical protein SEA_LIMPID_240 [Streptomyces phage Limpid]
MDIASIRKLGYALLLSSAALVYAGNEALEMNAVVLANFEFFVSMICFTNGGLAIYMTNGIK